MGILDSTAVEISAAVRTGRWTAEEVVAAHLGRIAADDGRWGAFRLVRHAAALAEACALDADPDGRRLPLASVPIAIKDNVAVTGETTGHGTAAVAAPTPARRDHEVVARLRSAGAVVVGITRVPELCLFAFTDSPEAVTRNPWNPARTAGGSSGGSAAAVASGMVPMAHGADGLGSLRIPAACCGLVTLKPGRGTVPAGLGVGDWYGMAENGILATTVADLAIGHSVLAGDAPPDRVEPPGRLRVGTSSRSPLIGTRPDADTRSGAAATQDPAACPARSAGQPAGLDPARSGPCVRGPHAGTVRGSRHRAHAGRDPNATQSQAVAPQRMVGQRRTSSRFAPYPPVWNLLGYPAMSVPMGTRRDGLPLAVQMIGRPGGEARMLAVAAELERELPWQRHARPPAPVAQSG